LPKVPLILSGLNSLTLHHFTLKFPNLSGQTPMQYAPYKRQTLSHLLIGFFWVGDSTGRMRVPFFQTSWAHSVSLHFSHSAMLYLLFAEARRTVQGARHPRPTSAIAIYLSTYFQLNSTIRPTSRRSHDHSDTTVIKIWQEVTCIFNFLVA